MQRWFTALIVAAALLGSVYASPEVKVVSPLDAQTALENSVDIAGIDLDTADKGDSKLSDALTSAHDLAAAREEKNVFDDDDENVEEEKSERQSNLDSEIESDPALVDTETNLSEEEHLDEREHPGLKDIGDIAQIVKDDMPELSEDPFVTDADTDSDASLEQALADVLLSALDKDESEASDEEGDTTDADSESESESERGRRPAYASRVRARRARRRARRARRRAMRRRMRLFRRRGPWSRRMRIKASKRKWSSHPRRPKAVKLDRDIKNINIDGLDTKELKAAYQKCLEQAEDFKRRMNRAHNMYKAAQSKRDMTSAVRYKDAYRSLLVKFRKAVTLVRNAKKKLLVKEGGMEGLRGGTRIGLDRGDEARMIPQKKIVISPAVEAAVKEASRPVFRSFMRWFMQTYLYPSGKAHPLSKGVPSSENGFPERP